MKAKEKGDWRKRRHYTQRNTLFPLPLAQEKAGLFIVLFISFPLSTLSSLHLWKHWLNSSSLPNRRVLS